MAYKKKNPSAAGSRRQRFCQSDKKKRPWIAVYDCDVNVYSSRLKLLSF